MFNSAQIKVVVLLRLQQSTNAKYYRSQLCQFYITLFETKQIIVPVNRVPKYDPTFCRSFQQNSFAIMHTHTIAKITSLERTCRDFQLQQPERTGNDRCFHTNKGKW